MRLVAAGAASVGAGCSAGGAPGGAGRSVAAAAESAGAAWSGGAVPAGATGAARSGVTSLSVGRIQTSTNQFFMKQAQTRNVQGGEQQIVDFLYNLGSGNSLIRVRDLSLHPDPQTRQQLAATIKLIASYQKNPTSKPASTPSRSAAPKLASSPAPSSAQNPITPPGKIPAK